MYYQKRANKYGAKKQVYGDRKYDSRLEARYAKDFDLLLKSGEAVEVIPQYRVDLRAYDKHICNYYVDFKIIYKDGSVEYVEIKGYATETWRLKWKLFEAQMNELEPDSRLVIYKQ